MSAGFSSGCGGLNGNRSAKAGLDSRLCNLSRELTHGYYSNKFAGCMVTGYAMGNEELGIRNKEGGIIFVFC